MCNSTLGWHMTTHDEFKDAVSAYQKQDYKTALPLFINAAQQGHADAQFNLGEVYSNGEGAPQDYAEAESWYRLAALQGHANAQFNLGVMYEDGQCVPQDYTEAEKWYRLAALQGNVDAQFNLGVMFENGQGVPQDYAQAHLWFNLAATTGDASAIEARDIVAGMMTPKQIEESKKMASDFVSNRLKAASVWG